MVSSYTANLAAFLTIEKPVPIITGLEDMYANTINKKISGFGAMAGGSTESFFKESDMELYKKIAEYMSKNPQMMMGKEEGLEKAKTEKYAYISESSTIEYYEQRHCAIAHVGDKLDEKGYGIAMKKGIGLFLKNF
jgi:glutamate receptor, ionotropic, invertebrate